MRGDLVQTPTGLRVGRRRIPCTIGRGGLTDAKREGDGATPVGVHHITGLLFRPDRVAASSLPTWAEPLERRDLWCDDPDHPSYNQRTRAPFGASHERLRRADPLYDVILLTDWNWPIAVPGAGSAIFLHRWRRPGFPTEGCIAMAPCDLRWLTHQAPPGTRLIVRS